MSDQSYLVLEYQTCQQKMSSAVDHLIRIELYVFLGVSALYTWFYAAVSTENPPSESIELVLYLPTLLAALAWYRSLMQITYIDSVAEYLRLIEEELANSKISDEKWPSIGWETWYDTKPRIWKYAYRLVLWPGLAIGTLAVAYFRIGVP